jgi:hypothetical protein
MTDMLLCQPLHLTQWGYVVDLMALSANRTFGLYSCLMVNLPVDLLKNPSRSFEGAWSLGSI